MLSHAAEPARMGHRAGGLPAPDSPETRRRREGRGNSAGNAAPTQASGEQRKPQRRGGIHATPAQAPGELCIPCGPEAGTTEARGERPGEGVASRRPRTPGSPDACVGAAPPAGHRRQRGSTGRGLEKSRMEEGMPLPRFEGCSSCVSGDCSLDFLGSASSRWCRLEGSSVAAAASFEGSAQTVAPAQAPGEQGGPRGPDEASGEQRRPQRRSGIRAAPAAPTRVLVITTSAAGGQSRAMERTICWKTGSKAG
jgi:hypothetical protein